MNGYRVDANAAITKIQSVMSQLVAYLNHTKKTTKIISPKKYPNIATVSFHCFVKRYLLQHNSRSRGFELEGVRNTAISLNR